MLPAKIIKAPGKTGRFFYGRQGRPWKYSSVFAEEFAWILFLGKTGGLVFPLNPLVMAWRCRVLLQSLRHAAEAVTPEVIFDEEHVVGIHGDVPEE
ncbi:MAG: hypothetical protein V4726_23035 [Verrucomicrobiota bacterium]